MANANFNKVVEESKGFEKFIGIGAFQLLAVCPNKAELEAIYGRELEKTPEYRTVDNETGVKGVRIDMFLKRVPCKGNTEEFDMLHKIAFFLKDTKIYNKEATSIKVINKYGRTTFIPIEHFEAHTLPANQEWFGLDYTACYPGQEELINFAVAYFAIPSLTYKRTTGEIATIKEPTDAEVYFEDFTKFFQLDFTELRNFILRPNKVKLLIGVKTTEDNKAYQDTFMGHFMKINTNSTLFIEKLVEEAKAVGKYQNTIFDYSPLHIMEENASTFAPSTAPISNVKAPSFGVFGAPVTPAPSVTPPAFGVPAAAEVVTESTDDLPF